MGGQTNDKVAMSSQTRRNLWQVMLDDAWASGQLSRFGVRLRIRRAPLKPAVIGILAASGAAIWIGIRVLSAVLS